jgi:hypothetical protein
LWAAVGLGLSTYSSEHHSSGARVLIGVGSFLGGVAVAAGTTLLVLVVRAPIRQRNEARDEVRDL